jgi:hypothetical protein
MKFLTFNEFINERYINSLSNHPYLTPDNLFPNVKLDNKSDEYLAIQLYQNGYTVTDIQKFLRTGKVSKKEADVIKLSVELIDKAFTKSRKFLKETILWRGVDGLNFYSSGDGIDKGYTSTAKTLNSTVKDWSIGGKILRIIAPKGMSYIDMNSYLNKSDIDGVDQEEFLLPRGLKFELDEKFTDYETYQVKK